MANREELEARYRELDRQLRHLRRQGFVPGKSVDLAAAEMALKRQMDETEQALAELDQRAPSGS